MDKFTASGDLVYDETPRGSQMVREGQPMAFASTTKYADMGYEPLSGIGLGSPTVLDQANFAPGDGRGYPDSIRRPMPTLRASSGKAMPLCNGLSLLAPHR
jgi:hypothetical protein